MDSFLKFLLIRNIFDRQYGSNSGCGCGCFLFLLIVLACFFVFLWENLFSEITTGKLIFIIITVLVYGVVISKIESQKQKNKDINVNDCENEKQSVDIEQIEKLAHIYIENNINLPDDRLTNEDYKKFNDIVQIENNIKIKTSCKGVPYLIREILYSEYQKKINDIILNGGEK